MEINVGVVRRPRNIDWKRAAALLYGDWGTSKAYVAGLAFAAAAYSSFWLVLGVSILTAIVGINYLWVCKYFPCGGGVYSSARHHSRNLALVGGFFLVANYIVTAAISSFEAFHYFGFSDQARRWAIVAIFAIGIMNFWGPRHSGMIAVVLAVPTLIVVIVLAICSIPYLQNVHLEPLSPHVWKNWTGFVGVILALSGVESIANMTGLMKKDPGSSDAHPTVIKTSSRAIWINLVEVCFFTAFFGLVMLAMPSPGGHEEAMLRYIGMEVGGEWLGILVSIVFGCLLLSAVNTAMMSMVSVLYLMTDDDEMPRPFASLNRYGVPWILMLIAILIPVFITDAVGNLAGLASLYAIGVVGAILINLASCAFNRTLPMPRHERVVMLVTSAILLAIEITIAVTMPQALVFILLILALGFAARQIHKSGAASQVTPMGSYGGAQAAESEVEDVPIDLDQISGGKILVAVRGITPSLKFAIEESKARKCALYVLYVREIAVNIPVGPARWQDDPVARDIFEKSRQLSEGTQVIPVYANSNLPAETIVEMACLLGVDFVILGTSERSGLVNFMKGNIVQDVIGRLPENVHLLIYG